MLIVGSPEPKMRVSIAYTELYPMPYLEFDLRLSNILLASTAAGNLLRF